MRGVNRITSAVVTSSRTEWSKTSVNIVGFAIVLSCVDRAVYVNIVMT